MLPIKVVQGFNSQEFPGLGGLLKLPDPVRDGEAVILMAGFLRPASKEKLLLEVANKLEKPALILDWHGLGMSGGDFGDVTVARLLLDLKRATGMLMSKGLFTFHLVGHGLAACVVAMAAKDPSLNTGKSVFLAPALNQEYLLRYWFARERGCELTYYQWKRFKFLQRVGACAEFKTNWDYEHEFLEFCAAEKDIKGIRFRPDYWMAEKDSNYLNFTQLDIDLVPGKNALFVCGGEDETVPLNSHDWSDYLLMENADHYFRGQEEAVAETVARFIT